MEDDIRLFSPEEARAVLPRLKPFLATLRDSFHEYRFARQQVDELMADYGEDPSLVAGHPMATEARAWKERAAAADARVREALERIGELGADVKDPIVGLVDFYHKRKNGEIVLLCYRDDEPTLDHWHALDAGFAGRRPLRDL